MDAVRGVRRGPSRRISLAATEAPAGVEVLLPGERELVGDATAARVAEFAAGRQCAHLALASLDPGLGGMPVLRDARGAPLWPAGVVGSITHCTGWSGAVAARSRVSRLGRGVRSVGLDAEPVAPLPDGVLPVVASASEVEVLTRLGGERPGIPWDTVLFCAKEATYKAWYPLTGILLSHAQVGVVLSAAGGFTAVASTGDATGQPAPLKVHGRWRIGPRVVVALGVVP